MKYLDMLRNDHFSIQTEIEEILKRNYVQPVGTGYIDLIVTKKYMKELLNDLTQANLIVQTVSWRCHCKEDVKDQRDCLTRMGGPQSYYFEGWFSETELPLYIIDEHELEKIDESNVKERVKAINNQVEIHLRSRKDKEVNTCMIPALWLFVPEEWNRIE